MHGLDVVHILLRAVARMPHIADHIPGGHHAALLKSLRVRIILAKMGIVVIPFAVKTADPDTPSPVLVPTEGFHIAGLHSDHGRADLYII